MGGLPMNIYRIPQLVESALCHIHMNTPMVKTLWNRFCLSDSELTLESCDSYIFRIGSTPLPELAAGSEYALLVDSSGAAITGRDFGGLMRGFFALLMKIEYTDDGFQIPFCLEQSHYLLKNRMLHICIFPENDLYFIKKLIRLAALCQYTHIVIEFWGMLQYESLPELAWPHAFTKEEAVSLIKECRELGMEPIPMLNMLGHATQSRLCYGKHVVLDQNPRLQPLFTPDGWAWNIRSERVHQLLKDLRKELYEIFGDGEYIHIGCDEAYYITRNDELRQDLAGYLKRLTTEIEQEGRRPMMWMDMLLEAGQFPDCYTVGHPEEAEALRNATAASTVFVDWQYDCFQVPIPSLSSLKDAGHDVLGAPWYNPCNYQAHIDTVLQEDLQGIMLTTWHTLKQYMPSILDCAKKCGASTFTWSPYSSSHEETATLLRRVSFEGNAYEDCGWSKTQIEM